MYNSYEADETAPVQDLGVALGRHVFTLNCNECMNHHHASKVLMAAVQTGAWTLYDNLNCLQPDVISVLASQISPVLQVTFYMQLMQ